MRRGDGGEALTCSILIEGEVVGGVGGGGVEGRGHAVVLLC